MGLFMVFQQCSPRTGQKMITFFFDGVPGTDSTSIQSTADSLEMELLPDPAATGLSGTASAMVVHYPYGERECETCHDAGSLGSMVEPQPDLCYLCHDNYMNSYAVLHGPVAGGYCTSCHDPHMSPEAKLLRFTGQPLCYYCHQQEDVKRNEMHSDLEGMACTDCHNPHGGEDRTFLY
jgi:predicted CXXCH cytochrome family protein